jgi:hypothetical protein
VQRKRATVARDKAYELEWMTRGMLTIWERMPPPAGVPAAGPMRAGVTSRSRRRENQPERVGALRHPSRLTEAVFAPWYLVVRQPALEAGERHHLRWRREQSCNAKTVNWDIGLAVWLVMRERTVMSASRI